MANQDSPLWERLGMDHGLSPPWTMLNVAKAFKFRLLIIPPEQRTIKRGKAFQMVNNRATYQRQSWIPEAPTGKQVTKCSLFLQQAMTIIWYLPSLKSTNSILTHV